MKLEHAKNKNYTEFQSTLNRDILNSPEALDTVRPFMDTAARLLDAYKENDNGSFTLEVHGSDAEIIKESPGLSSLISYAETLGRQSAESGLTHDVTERESIVLGAYTAEILAEVAESKCDFNVLTAPEIIREAADIAYDRATTSNVRDRTKLKEMESRLLRYATYLETGDNDKDIWHEFTASSYRAGLTLDSNTGTVRPTKYIRIGNAHQDAKWLQGRADMYDFLSELYPKKDDDKPVYVGLSDEQLREAQALFSSINTSHKSKDLPAKEALVPDGAQRLSFVREYFSQHTDISDKTNVSVLQEFIIKQVHDELNHAAKMGTKASDGSTLVFRLGAFTDETLEGLRPELRFTYKLLKNKISNLTYSDFDSMRIEELSSLLDIDIRNEVKNYDDLIIQKPVVKKLFPKIDK